MTAAIRSRSAGSSDGTGRGAGIRVTMPPNDPLRRVLGNDWHQEHWFATREERDGTLAEMARRHNFSRIGDAPSIRLDTLER